MGKEDNLIPFKPGVSGNPKGRPKGSKNISTILKEFLDLEIDVDHPITKAQVTLSLKDLAILKLIQAAAIDGDNKSINDIMDRIEGKPIQNQKIDANVKSIEIVDAGGLGGTDESNPDIQGEPESNK